MAVVARKRAVAQSDWRSYVTPTGVTDGANDTFTLSEYFINDGNIEPHVYLNGQRYELGEDFTVEESGGLGTGFDTIVLAAECIPFAQDKVRVDYLVA